MDGDEYDEFGNYIGSALSNLEVDPEPQGSELNAKEYSHGEAPSETGDAALDEHLPPSQYNEMDIVPYAENRIVLAEDKKYYLDASEVYPGVKTVLMDEDTQGIKEPIVKPIKVKNFSVLEKGSDIPDLKYNTDFLASLMATPTLVRNVAIVGQLHHGKTVFMDTLISSAIESPKLSEKFSIGEYSKHYINGKSDVRYSDTRLDEQSRELSIKATLVSLVLESVSSKSYLYHLIDCPGHVNFLDEMEAALRLVDGAVVVVDAVEGLMLSAVQAIRACVRHDIAITLCISKMDRLILELKIPPLDAFYKIQHLISEVNACVADAASTMGRMKHYPRLSPEKGNVCFSSAQHGWSFTLESFATQYCGAWRSSAQRSKNITQQLSPGDLAPRLWGDWFFDTERGSITKKQPASGSASRTFIQFILEPLYKIYSHVLGDEPAELVVTVKALGVQLTSEEASLDTKHLLRCTLHKFFGKPTGFVSMLAQHVPSPVDAAAGKVDTSFTSMPGSSADKTDSQLHNTAVSSMRACRSDGPLVIHITKLCNTPDGKAFHALGRVYSGVISSSDSTTVRIVGEDFTQADQEDVSTAVVDGISVGIGRYTVSIPSASAGNLVLLEGIDGPIRKSATVFASSYKGELGTFAKLSFTNAATVRLAVEPLKPADLPKLVHALRSVCKSYPLVSTKVEESGEHIVMAPGELSMDCVMHDLRHLYSDIELRLSDPVVSFCETVSEVSALKCTSATANKRNTLAVISEPLDRGLGNDIENGTLRSSMFQSPAAGYDFAVNFLQKKFGWDLLSSRSVWAFGPEENSPNVFLNDTLPSEVDSQRLLAVKESVVQGFRWAAREGPLCDEMLRGVKFKLLDASIAAESIYRGGGQIIPTARRIVYSSILTASPRLMEPIYKVEIQAPADVIPAVRTVLSRRRGRVISDMPKAGAPFYVMHAYLPVLESFGFETDLRAFTQGAAFAQSIFDHWAVLPGDPLDGNVLLHPLEPSPPQALARDCMVKTRRRKGLSDDVSISKYFDDDMIQKIRGEA